MNDQQRDILLDQVHRPSGTVGNSLPESIELDTEVIAFREVYFGLAEQDELDDEDHERIETILTGIRRTRRKLITQIETAEVDFETGQSLVTKIRELDRAINALESLVEPELAEQLRQEKIESAQELLELMRRSGKL